MSFPCILIPILVGLICALLGYFLGRLVEKQSKVYTKLRADLDACRKEKELLRSENNSLESEIASLSKKSTAAEFNAEWRFPPDHNYEIQVKYKISSNTINNPFGQKTFFNISFPASLNEL